MSVIQKRLRILHLWVKLRNLCIDSRWSKSSRRWMSLRRIEVQHREIAREQTYRIQRSLQPTNTSLQSRRHRETAVNEFQNVSIESLATPPQPLPVTHQPCDVRLLTEIPSLPVLWPVFWMQVDGAGRSTTIRPEERAMCSDADATSPHSSQRVDLQPVVGLQTTSPVFCWEACIRDMDGFTNIWMRSDRHVG